MIEAWEGIEVEGRLIGLPTLFFGCVDEMVPDALLLRQPHIYCNPQTLAGGYGEPIAARALDLGRIVTVVVTADQYWSLPADLRDACHIVLTTQQRWCALKSTDEVRLQFGDYHVWTTVFGSGVETQPMAYEDDQPLSERQISTLKGPESPEHAIRHYPAYPADPDAS